jgi:hypothetical protein
MSGATASSRTDVDTPARRRYSRLNSDRIRWLRQRRCGTRKTRRSIVNWTNLADVSIPTCEPRDRPLFARCGSRKSLAFRSSGNFIGPGIRTGHSNGFQMKPGAFLTR